MSTSLIGTTNELILNYDKQFNKNYDTIVSVDGTIQNKEQIIIQYNEVIMYKEKNIIILQYLIFLFIILGIIIGLYAYNKINLQSFIGISIFMIILFAFIIYFSVKKHFNTHNITKKLEGINNAMKDYAKKKLSNIVPPYTCPVTCDKKDDTSDEEGTNIPSTGYANPVPGDTLNINPQLNVWKNGSMPYNTQQGEEYEQGDEPSPFFGTTYPKSTYYECDWLGGGSRGSKGLPMGGPTTTKPYSTIPCSYKPNMKLNKKYICKRNPNTDPGGLNLKTTDPTNYNCEEIAI